MSIAVSWSVLVLALELARTPSLLGTTQEGGGVLLAPRSTQDCRPVSAADSADFVNLVRDIASSTTDGAAARALAMLPLASEDSVQSLMSPAACDSAAVYFRAALIATTGNSSTPLLPMRLVRVSRNRIVGDPAVVGGPGNKPQYVTFDSTFTVVKLWHAGP